MSDVLSRLHAAQSSRLRESAEFTHDAAADHRKALAEFKTAMKDRKKNPARFLEAARRLDEASKRAKAALSEGHAAIAAAKSVREGVEKVMATGARGGKYHLSKLGLKVYERKD